jgi:hypothetical protein
MIMQLFATTIVVHDLNSGSLLKSHYEHLRRDYERDLPADGVIGYANPPVRNYQVAGYIVEPLQTLTLARAPAEIMNQCDLAFGMGVFGFICGRDIRRLLTELFYAGIDRVLVREQIQKNPGSDDNGDAIDILSERSDSALRS